MTPRCMLPVMGRAPCGAGESARSDLLLPELVVLVVLPRVFIPAVGAESWVEYVAAADDCGDRSGLVGVGKGGWAGMDGEGGGGDGGRRRRRTRRGW